LVSLGVSRAPSLGRSRVAPLQCWITLFVRLVEIATFFQAFYSSSLCFTGLLRLVNVILPDLHNVILDFLYFLWCFTGLIHLFTVFYETYSLFYGVFTRLYIFYAVSSDLHNACSFVCCLFLDLYNSIFLFMCVCTTSYSRPLEGGGTSERVLINRFTAKFLNHINRSFTFSPSCME